MMLILRRALILVAVVVVLFSIGCNKQPSAPPTQQPIAGAITPPKLVKQVHAEFPKNLWNKPGTVVAAITIGTDGKVNDSKIVSSPHPELNPLALDAVKQWQFDPARQNGQPVPFTASVQVSFQPPAPGQATSPAPGAAQKSTK